MVTAIQKTFGNFEEIIEIQGRIQSTYTSLFPGAALLTNEEAFALAQVGYMQGLDVFNKEIYYLKQEKNGQVKAIGVMPGIRGLRKHAHRQIRYEGGRSANFWFEFFQILDTEEKSKVGAGPNDLVFKALLRDSVTMRNYLEMRQMIFGNRNSWGDLLKVSREDGDAIANITKTIENQATSILGFPPIIVSYGIVKYHELKKDGDKLMRPLQMVNTQNPYYMAEIRAERRGLYKRFDLEKQFGVLDAAALDAAEEMDAVIEAEEDKAPEVTTQEPRTQEQTLRELNPDFVKPEIKQERIWTVAQKQVLIDTKLAGNDFAAKGMLGLSNLPQDANEAQIRKWGELYRERRPDPKAKDSPSSADAALYANERMQAA